MPSHTDTIPAAVPDDLEEWREIIDRIDVLEVPIEAFLDKLVPSSVPYVPDEHEHVRDCLPIVTEPVARAGLTAFLSALVTSFPEDKKVAFLAGGDRLLQAPFEVLRGTHHLTAADIGVSLPGEPLGRPAERWQQLSMVIEFKQRESCDPFDRDDLLNYSVTHPAACAHNLMLAHGFLASFVLGVYGSCCRILRFDHASGLVSEAFDYTKHPDLLRQFFWHFVHPRLGDTVVGCDPTAHALAPSDTIRTEARLATLEVDAAVFKAREARRVDVYDDACGSVRTFVLLKALSAERRLFSRATTVWLAVEDAPRGLTRSDDTTPVPRPKLVIVKEAWREIKTRSEVFIYQMLQHAQGEERFGLPQLVCGADLGEREVALWSAGGASPYKQGPAHDPRSLETESGEPLRGRLTNTSYVCNDPYPPACGKKASLSTHADVHANPRGSSVVPETIPREPKYPLPFPQHQTFSWRLTGELEFAYRERSQMRLVIDVVGRPLSEFRSTKQLVRAIRDAVKGHENAWKMGILHRDISEGNVLLVDEELGSLFPFTAFLHDFDYSWFKSEWGGPSLAAFSSSANGRTPSFNDAVLLGQTGTPPFMAIEIHKQRTFRYLGHAVKHDVHHDLESFYWLLVWMVLRHTRYVHTWGRKAERTLFGCSDHTFFASMKAVWLDMPALAVWHNAPLTRLLRRFADAVRANNPGVPDARGPRETVHLTHANVLEILDDALSGDDWPDDDPALCREEREAWRTHSALRPGEKRVHDGLDHRGLEEGGLDVVGSPKRRKT